MSGIFGDCPRDAVIDHAVTLIAYGQAAVGAGQGQKVWEVRETTHTLV